MTKDDIQFYNTLFLQLRDRWSERKEISILSRFLNDPGWVLIRETGAGAANKMRAELGTLLRNNIEGRHLTSSDIGIILAAVGDARKSGHLQELTYNKNLKGLCYPLAAKGEVFGFVLVLGVLNNVSPNVCDIFKSLTDTIIHEIQLETELEELNKTIRPRAIALSTVHTVHRLLGSTLDLNELLSRVVRLSLQVMRANRCSIKLVDKKRKVLLPKTTVDLRKENAKLKKVEIGKYAPGRAVKQGRIIRGRNYLAVPLIEDEVLGVITLYDKLSHTEFTSSDEEIMKTLAEQAVIAIKNAQLYQEQANLTMASIKCIAMLLEARPHGTRKPEASFLKLLNIIGRKFYMNETETRMMQYAALLHDAGKIAIPEKVLMKKGGLTGKELDIIKMHSMKGAMILSKIKPLKPIIPIILYHHENYDGTGYPRGLKGTEIPLSARILAVVSSFEAMIAEKPYRRSLSIAAALKEVQKNTGTQFDPEVVRVFSDAVTQKSVIKLIEKEMRKRWKEK